MNKNLTILTLKDHIYSPLFLKMKEKK